MLTLSTLRDWARRLNNSILSIWIASRDHRTPKTAKVVAILVAGYALSPIDLIPDFIPILGYLDDLIIVPIGMAVVIRLVPKKLMSEFTQQAAQLGTRPVSKVAAIVVVLIWMGMSVALFATVY